MPLAIVDTATASYVVQASYMQVCTMASARASAVGPRSTLALAWSAVLSHVTTGVWSVAALTWRMTGPRRDSRASSPAAAAASPRPARSTLRRLIGCSKVGLLSSCKDMVLLSFLYLPLSAARHYEAAITSVWAGRAGFAPVSAARPPDGAGRGAPCPSGRGPAHAGYRRHR